MFSGVRSGGASSSRVADTCDDEERSERHGGRLQVRCCDVMFLALPMSLPSHV